MRSMVSGTTRVRVGARRLRELEVVARGEMPGVVRQVHPVAVLRRAAEGDLVAAVGRDIEVRVVDHPCGARGVPAVGSTGIDRDRRVDRPTDVAAHLVHVPRVDGRVEVDGVGVVTEHLAPRRDPLREARVLGVAFELAVQRGLEQVDEETVAVDVVPLARHPEVAAQVALVDLGERIEQITERLAALGLDHVSHDADRIPDVSRGAPPVRRSGSPRPGEPSRAGRRRRSRGWCGSR